MLKRLRLIAMGLIAVMAFVMVAACSSNGTNNTEKNKDNPANKGTDAKSEEVTLNFWTISLHPNFDDYINGRIRKFEDEHPGMKVKWTDLPYGAIENKLLTSIAGGRSPDVVNLNTGMTLALASKNALVDLNKEATEEQRSIYFPTLFKSTAIGDSSYAFPWYASIAVMMYNKQIFEAAGLDPNNPPLTWEEVKAQSKIIKEKTGIYGFVPTGTNIAADLFFSGVPIVDDSKQKIVINTPEALKYAKFMKSLYDEDVVPQDGLTGGYTFALNQYQAGQLGMLLTGSQFLDRIKKNSKEVYDNTLIAKMPAFKEGGKISSPLMDVVIPKLSSHHKEAIEFASFITNDESQLAFAKVVNILPSTQKAAADPFFTESGDTPEAKAKVITAASLPQAIDFSTGIVREGEIFSILNEHWQKMLLGQQSPEDALATAETEMQKKLDEINANN